MMNYQTITTNINTPGSTNPVPYNKYDTLVSLSVKEMFKTGIRCLLIDFDQTILRIHGFSELMKSGKSYIDFTEGRDMAGDFANLELFKSLVHCAQKEGLMVWIVSFGKKELIDQYLYYARVTVNVSTPSSVGYLDGSQVPVGKNRQIFKILLDTYLQPWECLLIDDDSKNCSLAQSAGVNAFNVSKTGITTDEFSKMMQELYNKDCTKCFEAMKHSTYIECNRTKAEQLLMGQPVGKFITRLAISEPFNVCISYVGESNKIVHALLTGTTTLDSLLSNQLMSPI
jgi:hypothetical protein